MAKGGWLIGVLVLLLIVSLSVSFVYLSDESGVVGDVVDAGGDEGREIAREVRECSISEPFSCVIWRVSPEQREFVVQVRNLGTVDYLTDSFSVDNCDSDFGNYRIGIGDTIGFVMNCDLPGDEFVSELSMVYKPYRGGESEVAEGAVVFSL